MEHIKQELYKYSLHKEKQQSNFLRNQQNLKNVKTGEVLSLKYSFDFKQKEYVKTIEQKVNALVSIAIELINFLTGYWIDFFAFNPSATSLINFLTGYWIFDPTSLEPTALL